MAGEFFPRRESEFRFWSAALAAHLVAAPQDYWISQQRADQYALLHAQYAQAFDRSIDPGTATRAAVVARRQAKAPLVAELRRLNGYLKSFLAHHAASGDPSRLVKLGLNPRPRGGRVGRLPRPDAAPIIHIESVSGHQAEVRLKAAQSGAARGRPRAVKGANIYYFIGSNPSTNLKDWKFIKDTVLTRLAVEFPKDLPPGTAVSITAQWKNARGQAGPAAAAVTFNLPGGTMGARTQAAVKVA